MAVEETKLDGNKQTDFTTLPLPHTTIATAAEVVPLVVSFLHSSSFGQP